MNINFFSGTTAIVRFRLAPRVLAMSWVWKTIKSWAARWAQRNSLLVIKNCNESWNNLNFLKFPFSHVPCYPALFGPKLFGHGTKVESHKSFGKKVVTPSPKSSPGPVIPRAHIDAKLKTYNQFYNNKSLEMKAREVNGRVILEGALRIYWGIQGVIHLKEDDDQRFVVTIRKRNSVRYPNSVDIVRQRLILIAGLKNNFNSRSTKVIPVPLNKQ